MDGHSTSTSTPLSPANSSNNSSTRKWPKPYYPRRWSFRRKASAYQIKLVLAVCLPSMMWSRKTRSLWRRSPKYSLKVSWKTRYRYSREWPRCHAGTSWVGSRSSPYWSAWWKRAGGRSSVPLRDVGENGITLSAGSWVLWLMRRILFSLTNSTRTGCCVSASSVLGVA